MIANVTNATESTESTENTDKILLRESSVFSVFSVASTHRIATQFMPISGHNGAINYALFHFAKRLRRMFPDSPVEEMEPHVDVWYKAAITRLPDLEWTDIWWDFMAKWESVKFPDGDALMEMIVDFANGSEPPACAIRYDGKVRRLVHILQRLQIEVGDRPFFLSCRMAEKMIGVPHEKAARWLKNLVREGVLEITKIDPARRSATRYRYLGDL